MRGSRSSCTAWRAMENAPEITACEAITVAAVASTTIQRQQRLREQRITGAWIGCRLHAAQRTLAEVVEQQRRPHQREPGDAHRLLAEVAHVRVQRLPAGHARNTAPMIASAIGRAVEQQLSRRTMRVDAPSAPPGRGDDRDRAGDGQRPRNHTHHDRAEQLATCAVPRRWIEEQHHDAPPRVTGMTAR